MPARAGIAGENRKKKKITHEGVGEIIFYVTYN